MYTFFSPTSRLQTLGSMQSRAPHQIRHRNKNTQTTAHSLSKTQSVRLLLLLQYFDSESYKEGKN